MPQSLSRVVLHIIFSTKDREPWLDSNVRPRMHAYLATICRDVGTEFVHVGGVADHVHIVTTLPRTLSQAQLIEQIKKTSSKWIKAVDHVRLAARIWRIFREPEPARRCAAIHRWAKRTPSHSHLSGRISRVVAPARRRFRGALCLGLRIAPSIESRLQRLFRVTLNTWGVAPGSTLMMRLWR